jgi:hypothetical protein
VSRSRYLSDSDEQKLNEVIDDYRNRGEGGWSLTNPCSGFASEAWNEATGEHLSDGWPISTPTTLKQSILDKNGGLPHVAVAIPIE